MINLIRASSASADGCYSQSDILSSYHLKNGALEPLVGEIANLHQKAGKLILRQNKALEANNFDQGLAQGYGKLTFFSQHNHASNDSYLSGNFVNGCLNGLIRGYEYLPLDGIEEDASYDSPALNSVLYYKKGYPNGPIWKILYSPDGIVLGYFYVERPLLPETPNAYFEFR